MVGSLSDRARLTFFTVSQAKRSALGVLRRSPFLRWRYTGPPAQRLLLVPPDLRTADPSLAHEMSDGQMGLAGTVALLNAGSPFNVTPPSQDWLRDLHGFGWLRNLAATQDPEMRTLARDLIKEWIRRERGQAGMAWNADVVARRIISWLSNSGFLLTETDQKFYDTMMTSLTRQMRFLVGSYDETPDGAPRLQALIALLLAGLCMSGQQAVVDVHKPAFLAELDRQILRDGGHISRNPELLAELLLDLLPVKQCFVVREEHPPEALDRAIKRMIPMIRFFRLGDNALARFNGSGQTRYDNIATVMAYQDIEAEIPIEAPVSGYYKLEAGGMMVMVDAGTPPPLLASSTAHASCLAFELTCGPHPVFVNCGAPSRGKSERRLYSRQTEAHNTLVINGASSSQFLDRSKFDRFFEAPFLTGPDRVEVEQVRTKTEDSEPQEDSASRRSRRPKPVVRNTGITARHDGYLRRNSLWHRRILDINDDGTMLSGTDKIIPVRGFKGVKFALHFHVHPSIEVMKAPDKPNTMVLTLPDGSQYLFTAAGPLFSDIKESVFLAYHHGPRKTLQVELTGLAAVETTITWRLTRKPEETGETEVTVETEPKSGTEVANQPRVKQAMPEMPLRPRPLTPETPGHDEKIADADDRTADDSGAGQARGQADEVADGAPEDPVKIEDDIEDLKEDGGDQAGDGTQTEEKDENADSEPKSES